MAFLLAALFAGEASPVPPDPGARAFDWTIGSWTGRRLAVASGDVEPMILRVAPILGGSGQARELEVGNAEDPYRGFAVQIFDRSRDLWIRQYTHAGRGSFSTLEGRIESPDRSVWRVVSTSRVGESRLLSERLGPRRWRRTMSISEDGGASWRDLWIDELERTTDR